VVLTVSEYSQHKIQQHLGVQNVAITTNGISGEFYKMYDKGEVQAIVAEKFGIENYIIYISRWESRKNQDLLLRAFAESGLHKTHKLVFVGGHSFENNKYEEYFDSLSTEVKGKVADLGNVDFADVLLLLRGALLFAYPSAAEGFGIPPLEAIAADIPTISSNRTSMADFDFIDDYFFDPSNLDEFKYKLLLALKAGNNEAQQKKKFTVRERFNWKQSAIAFNQAIEGRIYY
uniref:glycosyltransferase n=1 Tax=uncultured Flavobacterium sp. TaxID=165435 RepID=UPI0025F9F362